MKMRKFFQFFVFFFAKIYDLDFVATIKILIFSEATKDKNVSSMIINCVFASIMEKNVFIEGNLNDIKNYLCSNIDDYDGAYYDKKLFIFSIMFLISIIVFSVF